jgi:hypothetical protein
MKMRKALPYLLSLFFLFTALTETCHVHEQGCDAPCPAACLCGAPGACCAAPGSRCSLAPADISRPAAACAGTVAASRLSVDEIFHPPAA